MPTGMVAVSPRFFNILFVLSLFLSIPGVQAQLPQEISFAPTSNVKEGEVASNIRIRNKIILGGSRNLTYRRTSNGAFGIALQRGKGSFRLVAQNIISLIEVSALSDGTFTFWDNNPDNQMVSVSLQKGEIYVIDSRWIKPSRWMKFSWAGTGQNSPIVLMSVVLGSLGEFRQPTATPTAVEVVPTNTPIALPPTSIPTLVPPPIPTISPTTIPTQSPTPVQTHIPTYTVTASPSPTSDTCPGFIVEGFGRGTTGGCGGQIYTVTTLEDPATAIPGTFRYGAEKLTGARIIRFAVSGTLALRKDISIVNGNLTIDGSGAPGGGIQFSGGTIIVGASNVILRHLRVLVGPYSQNPGKADNIRIVGEQGTWVEHVVVDHCSMLWATDENLSITDMVRKVTIQWSIVAEGLYLSTHGKTDPHSMGTLLHHDATQMTFHHNLFAHNNYRNPQLASRGALEWINNVVYNTGSAAGILQTQDIGDENWLDAIGNFNKMGPNSDWVGARYRYSWREGVVFGISHLFVQGNIDWNRKNLIQDERTVVAPYLWKWISPTRLVSGSEVAITSAAQAYEDVLANAGASAPCRSPVDRRILEETRNGSGGFINYPSERGGWPDLTLGCQ